MSKVAIISDTHAGARNDSLIFNEYFLRFYNDVFFPYLESNDISTVIHAGDVFDRRKYINFQTVYSWKENVFKKLNDSYITHIIVGNHDCYWKNTLKITSPMEMLGQYENIHVYNKPEKLISGIFEECPIMLVPWIIPSEMDSVVSEIKKTQIRVLIGHFEIKGFEILSGFFNKDSGFEEKFFDRFDMVISGHYHNRSSHGNITYVGAPYQITWNDFGIPKGFHVLDLETQQLEFVENPHKIFHKLTYDGNTQIEDFSHLVNTYVKLLVKNKDSQLSFDMFMDALNKVNPADVIIVDDSMDESGDIEVDETKDTLSILVDYISELQIKNKDNLIKLMSNLYRQATNLQSEL
jgi:DNA repair exonuclease SbcCD nuclease subunit